VLEEDIARALWVACEGIVEALCADNKKTIA
jgi:hypothetical protein